MFEETVHPVAKTRFESVAGQAAMRGISLAQREWPKRRAMQRSALRDGRLRHHRVLAAVSRAVLFLGLDVVEQRRAVRACFVASDERLVLRP